MRVGVAGAAGQLGAVVVQRFRAAGHEVTGWTRQQLDITRHTDIVDAVRSAAPDVVLNCAAYNDVDGAESNYDMAFDVNAFAVRSLARAVAETGAALVHYSTDFVFDGTASAPYTEHDRPNPQSVYAASKLLGEWFAADALRHYVLRVESLFGGPAARSSIDRIIDALMTGRETRVFVDRVVSPSYVDDVAQVSERLLTGGAPTGLYHVVNDGHTTWHGLAQEIARQAGASESLLVPVSVADVQLKASRPKFAALANGRLRAAGIEMPTWQDAVARYFDVRNRRATR